MTSSERRQFKRLHAPVLCRPLGAPLVGQLGTQKVQDISLGGVCVYTDDAHKVGEHLELELFFPGGDTVTLHTLIVWIDTLEASAPAKFEIGLQYVDLAATDLARIETVLKDK